MRKLRSSTKIGAVAVLVAIGGYFGQMALSEAMIGRERFAPVAPGRVNLVGINPGAGYHIVIANDVAQLVVGQGGFGAKETEGAGATEGAIKKRVPMRELLGVLRGDGSKLGPFVMKMNDQDKEDEWPPIRVDWGKADLDKAIAGDPKLRTKLEHDLNVHLDGSPLATLDRASLENGIFVHSPIELTVNIDGKPTVVRGEVLAPYKPTLVRAVEARYQDKANVNGAMVAGYYTEEARDVMDHPARRENVAASIGRMVSKETMDGLLETPRHLLESATVVLNEGAITDASSRDYTANDGKPLTDLTVDLTDEGRRRLWKFSKDRVGDQILLVADDVAIAAPRIEHELALSELTVTQLRDRGLVEEAVATIKGSKGKVARE